MLATAALALFAITAVEQIRVSGLSPLPFLLLIVTMIAVGWLLAWKRPGNPLGWIVLAVPALFSGVPVTLLGEALLPSARGVAAWLLWFGDSFAETWAWIPPVWLLLIQIPLRFPDGHLPSPRWRWFFWFTIASLIASAGSQSTLDAEVAPGVANPLFVAWDADTTELLATLGFGSLLLSFVGAIASLIVRYRRADSMRRAQLRWIFWAVCLSVAVLLVTWILPPEYYDLVQGWLLLAYSLIPVSIAVAVLRYRLYDIDRIISRTASYAIVTLLLVGLYALVIVSISAILPELPSVAVALATLAAAGVFLPVLRRVQALVDRRFDRARYNGQKVVDAFGERLRNGADPHTAAIDLNAAVEASLQPVSMGLWLADDGVPTPLRVGRQ